MKRIISVILTVVIALSVSLFAVADGRYCNCGIDPVVFVHGFGSYSLYEDIDSKNPAQVFPPDSKAIIKSVPSIIDLIGNLTVTGNTKRSAEDFMKVLEYMMGRLACDKNGNSLYNVTIENRPLPTEDRHKTPDYSFDTQSDEITKTSQYSFYYDFRLDPMDNAKDLNDYIGYIKNLTGHSKVAVVCHSQGNTVVAAYLSMYKNRDVSKVIFLSPAYKGLSLIGHLFNSELDIRNKSDDLELYFKGMLGYSPSGQFIGALISLLNDCGVLPYLTRILQDMLDDQYETILNEELLKVFGTMPAIWSFCPDEYYERAKAKLLDPAEYSGLIKRIDNYHYNVQNKFESILRDCESRGMKFAITCGYDISTIPVADNPQSQSDVLIDTEYMSIGCTCADAGTCFGDNYRQAKHSGRNYISPDKKIDASTCLYPDRTWFFKGQKHDDFTAAYTQFLTKLLLFDGQPTIDSISGYSQFMCYDDDMNLIPVKGADEPETKCAAVTAAESVIDTVTPDFVRRIKIW